MRKILLASFCLALTCLALTATAQQVFKTTSSSVIGYLEYLPKDYIQSSGKTPIVIFLHGIGERGADSKDPAVLATTIQNVAKIGPPMYVKNGHQFPFILISPQLKKNFGTWPSWYVKEVIDHVKTYLRVDEKRIYITGLSLGGGGTWVAAQDFPELFAAAAPVCGGYNSPSKACNLASENLPVWAFHGDADTIVPLSRTVNMVNAINACLPTPSPLAKLTIYPNVAHNSWNNAYRVDHNVHNPNVYDWILSFTNTVNKGNKIPTASAGSDKSVTLPNKAIFYGGGSDADGSIVSYAWAQISGPSIATLTNAGTKTLTASNLVAGTYEFRNTVKDNSGNTDSDYVKLVISTSTNKYPVVSSGSDVSVLLPTNYVTLNGTASDADGTIASYAWTKISGGAATLSGATTSSLSVKDMVEGSYTFRLTVTDNAGAKKYDDVIVTVTGQTVNQSPAVSAGADATLTLPTNYISIKGSASDTDGTIASYAWSKVSGSTVSMSGATTSTLSLSNMVEGTYTFRLTVTDNAGAKKSDDVVVMVTGSSTQNQPPVANAGSDKSIALPASSITLYGSAKDTDGYVKYYKWYRISGPYAYMYGVSKPTLELSQMKAGTYVFRLVVTDDDGATNIDEVTVIVSDGTASITTTEGDFAFAPVRDTPKTILGAYTMDDLESATVIVYNDQGNRLFKGEWDEDTFQDVFVKQGFYAYAIVRDGQRVNSGKIYIH